MANVKDTQDRILELIAKRDTLVRQTHPDQWNGLLDMIIAEVLRLEDAFHEAGEEIPLHWRRAVAAARLQKARVVKEAHVRACPAGCTEFPGNTSLEAYCPEGEALAQKERELNSAYRDLVYGKSPNPRG